MAAFEDGVHLPTCLSVIIDAFTTFVIAFLALCSLWGPIVSLGALSRGCEC